MPSNDGVTATPHTSHSYFDSTSSSFARSGAPIVLTLAFTSLARLSCRSRRTPRTRYRSTCRNRPTRLQVSIAPCTRHTSRTAPCCMACGPLERLSLSFRPPSRANARRSWLQILTARDQDDPLGRALVRQADHVETVLCPVALGLYEPVVLTV